MNQVTPAQLAITSGVLLVLLILSFFTRRAVCRAKLERRLRPSGDYSDSETGRTRNGPYYGPDSATDSNDVALSSYLKGLDPSTVIRIVQLVLFVILVGVVTFIILKS